MKNNLPREFDGYSLIKKLGRGGMGEVHLALDTLLDRNVAIKFITSQQSDEIVKTRFLLEARAFARLQHPNVVSIYRVGEVNGFPYLVSEYVKGRPLDSLAAESLTNTEIIRIASGIARGLAAAHKQGVIHRDIKPGNVMIADTGDAKLLDFGIAKLLESMSGSNKINLDEFKKLSSQYPTAHVPDNFHENITYTEIDTIPEENSIEFDALFENTPLVKLELTRPGTAIGTPRYMAPEVWRGMDATFRSDIYSFGALLYYLCCGRPPHNGDSAKEIGKKCITTNAFPLQNMAPGIHPGIAAVVNKCLKRNPMERYADGNELRIALAQLTPEMRSDVSPEGNPYRGLYPFEEEHKNLFFGRDSEIRLILERLKTDPLVVVVGDSGVGKSSLCKAGVIPRVSSWLGDNRLWQAVTLIPGIHPVASLCAILSTLVDHPESYIETTIRTEPANVSRMLRANIGPQSGVVIFIDQLEELITISDPKESEIIAEVLAWLSIITPGIRLLATVRGDFLSTVAAMPKLSNQISQSLFFLRPMTQERIRESIIGPATAKGVSFESESMIMDLVNSSREAKGGLPLLQFTLRELWEIKTDDIITKSNLKKLGGVEGALSRHANNVFGQLAPTMQNTAKNIIISLITPQKTRARKTINQLNPGQVPAISTAINILVRSRLIVAQDSSNGPCYELAHEALILSWSTLASWLSANEETELIKDRLKHSALEWKRLDFDKSLLWTGKLLEESNKIPESELDHDSIKFLHLSRKQKKYNTFAKILLLLLAPVSIFIIFMSGQLHSIDKKEKTTEKEFENLIQKYHSLKEIEKKAKANKKHTMDLFRSHQFSNAKEAYEQLLKEKEKIRSEYTVIKSGLEQTILKANSANSSASKFYGQILYDLAKWEGHTDSRLAEKELVNKLHIHGRKDLVDLLVAPGTVLFSLISEEEPPYISIRRYVEQKDGQFSLTPLMHTLKNKETISLERGSYLAQIEAGSIRTINYPFFIKQGEDKEISFRLPTYEDIPEDMIFIPAGEFKSGADLSFFKHFKLHQITPVISQVTGSFLISPFEVTIGQWLEYLDSIKDIQFPLYFPKRNNYIYYLNKDSRGEWTLNLELGQETLSLRRDESLSIDNELRDIEWTLLPITGISANEAQEYIHWLNSSGTFTGARLCTELEWERAARGADLRLYPQGNNVSSFHAAIYPDSTSKRLPLSSPIGSYPTSDSPFGVSDMTGNAKEWTLQGSGAGFALRGGSFLTRKTEALIPLRKPADGDYKTTETGLRICADLKTLPK